MRIPFRVAVAIALVGAIFVLKQHLNSIGEQWQSAKAQVANYVVNEDGAHIELVSGRVSSARYDPTPAPSKTWLEPTKPALPKPDFVPQQIPVDVPEPQPFDWYLDDYLEELQLELEMAQQEEEEEKKKKKEKQRTKPPRPTVSPMTDRVVVLGKMSWEDTDWLDEELPEWQHAVYTVNDPNADLTVQENKGKESNVYLQYIVDNYDKLPQYMVFLHAHQFSYHVEFEEQDNALSVKRLQLDYVKKVGYANLRCDWGPGCPNEVQPFRQLEGRTTEIAFAGAWIGIFNNTDIPYEVGTPCCAQFVVTREQVHARPLSDYQQYHRWLLETQLDDETSGRVFEYLWHIIFGQDAISCPEKELCYWNLYGIDISEPVDDLDFDGSSGNPPPISSDVENGPQRSGTDDNDPTSDTTFDDVSKPEDPPATNNPA
ncbi:hypothetical protein N7468_007818, partial [Penicillium chermesinum]